MISSFPQYDAEQLLSIIANENKELIRLQVAENILLFEDLAAIFTQQQQMKVADIEYQPSTGQVEFRQQIGTFLSQGFSLQPALDAKQVFCFAGTRSALEVASQFLLKKSDVAGPSVMIPTPYWQGFNWIFLNQLEGSIVQIPLRSENNFALSLADIQQAYDLAANPKPKAIVLTNPNNPLGINYEPKHLSTIFDWVLKKTEMHIFSDEIYAHCQMEGIPNSDFKSALAFPQALAYPDRVHIFWGFAKDFGLSGFRVGVLASRNEGLATIIGKTPRAGFSPMTSSNNWLLKNLFKKESSTGSPAKKLMQNLFPKLNKSFSLTKLALERNEIPFFRATNAAQFAWLDLRKWLPKVREEEIANFKLNHGELLDHLQLDAREGNLNKFLIEKAKVMLLPGQTLSTSEPGFFRLCYTCTTIDQVVLAIDRIGEALKELN